MGEIKDISTLLLENEFFDGFSLAHTAILAKCGKQKNYNAGDYLLREGETANALYAICSGEVAIESHLPAKGSLVIAKMGAGEVVGYSWLYPPYRSGFDAVALNDLSVIELCGDCLRQRAEADHELGYLLMKRFAQIMLDRMQASRRQMLDIYGRVETANVSS